MPYNQKTKKAKHGRIYKWFHDVRPIRVKESDIYSNMSYSIKDYYLRKEKDKNNKVKYTVYGVAKSDYSAHPKIFVTGSFKNKKDAIISRNLKNAYLEGQGSHVYD